MKRQMKREKGKAAKEVKNLSPRGVKTREKKEEVTQQRVQVGAPPPPPSSSPHNHHHKAHKTLEVVPAMEGLLCVAGLPDAEVEKTNSARFCPPEAPDSKGDSSAAVLRLRLWAGAEGDTSMPSAAAPARLMRRTSGARRRCDSERPPSRSSEPTGLSLMIIPAPPTIDRPTVLLPR